MTPGLLVVMPANAGAVASWAECGISDRTRNADGGRITATLFGRHATLLQGWVFRFRARGETCTQRPSTSISMLCIPMVLFSLSSAAPEHAVWHLCRRYPHHLVQRSNNLVEYSRITYDTAGWKSLLIYSHSVYRGLLLSHSRTHDSSTMEAVIVALRPRSAHVLDSTSVEQQLVHGATPWNLAALSSTLPISGSLVLTTVWYGRC